MSSSSKPKARSTFAKQMALLSRIIMPKPKVGYKGPRTAYMLRKDRRSKPKSGASRISAERRFVRGLGYIRADATPIRSRAAKAAASGRSLFSPVSVETTDVRVCSELIAMSEPRDMSSVPSTSSRREVGNLYDQPRFPSTMTRSWSSFEYQSE